MSSKFIKNSMFSCFLNSFPIVPVHNVIKEIIPNTINIIREEIWRKFLQSSFWNGLDYKTKLCKFPMFVIFIIRLALIISFEVLLELKGKKSFPESMKERNGKQKKWREIIYYSYNKLGKSGWILIILLA